MTKQPGKLSHFLTEITEPYLAFLRGLTPALLFFVLYMVMTEYIKDPEFRKGLFFYINEPDLIDIVYYVIRCFVAIPLLIMLSAYLLSLRSFYLKQQNILAEIGFSQMATFLLWAIFWLIQLISSVFVVLFAVINFYKIYDSLFLMS